MQAITYGPMHQRGGHGGIHTARQTAYDRSRFAHGRADCRDLLVDEAFHGPVGRETTLVLKEAFDACRKAASGRVAFHDECGDTRRVQGSGQRPDSGVACLAGDDHTWRPVRDEPLRRIEGRPHFRVEIHLADKTCDVLGPTPGKIHNDCTFE